MPVVELPLGSVDASQWQSSHRWPSCLFWNWWSLVQLQNCSGRDKLNKASGTPNHASGELDLAVLGQEQLESWAADGLTFSASLGSATLIGPISSSSVCHQLEMPSMGNAEVPGKPQCGLAH